MISTSYYTSRADGRGMEQTLARIAGRYSSSLEAADTRGFFDVPYQGNGEDRHTLDLYLPNRRTFPVVVFAHGGAWISGDKALHADLGFFLAKHGIGAALLNYRLAPQVRHPTPAQDLARAFAWTRQHIGSFGGDLDRLYLCGHSAGGHSAALVGTDETFLSAEGLGFEHVRGVIAISGVYKIHWNITLARLGFVFRDANRKDASPFWHVKRGCPSFLLLLAAKELWTLSSQSYQFHERLLAHHCPSRMVLAHGEDHHTIVHTVSLPTATHGAAIINFIQDE